RLPRALDHPDQRRGAPARSELQPAHGGPQARRRRDQPEDPRRSRGARSRGVRTDRRGREEQSVTAFPELTELAERVDRIPSLDADALGAEEHALLGRKSGLLTAHLKALA